ncbi:MAG: hypothetical protein QM820_38665 [Minicystis sp.]
MGEGTLKPLDRTGDWPLAGLVRRPAASEGSFGDLEFSFALAIRRTDDTVVVQVEWPGLSAELMDWLCPLGVEQLTLGRTTCRARVVGWDTALRAVIFELHRPVLPAIDTPLASAA